MRIIYKKSKANIIKTNYSNSGYYYYYVNIIYNDRALLSFYVKPHTFELINKESYFCKNGLLTQDEYNYLRDKVSRINIGYIQNYYLNN